MSLTEIQLEACAQAAHEANRAFCIALGDESQPSWETAPDWQRASSRTGVKAVLDGDGPEQLHQSWLAEKFSDGWQYGAIKDPEKKEHPCCVPYAALPSAQKLKDHVFLGVVKTMLQAFGIDT